MSKRRPALLCACGHDRHAHEHYRRGSECSLCDCQRWSPPYLRWLLRRPQRGGASRI